MSLQVQHPVADWYLAFDDLWELMRVNWHTHNTFTQAGMWNAEDQIIGGILLVIDDPPYRGVLLRVEADGEDDYITIVTYGPKCNECGYQPYNALWLGGDGEGEALIWSATTISQMIANAEESGVEKRHEDGCSHLRYVDDPEEGPHAEVDDDGGEPDSDEDSATA